MSPTSSVLRADSADTQQRLLGAAEALFTDRGYSGTSMRAIAGQAGVNLAAANYHFGTKENLLRATFERCVAPMNAARLAQLADVEAQTKNPAVCDIVRAFLEPGLPSTRESGLPKLLARVIAESKEISVPLLEQAFTPIALRFLTSLQKVLPNLSAADLSWRFHFMIGATVHLANFDQPVVSLQRKPKVSTDDGKFAMEQLIQFVTAGLCQNAPAAGGQS